MRIIRILSNPDVQIEQTHLNSYDLMRQMNRFLLDGLEVSLSKAPYQNQGLFLCVITFYTLKMGKRVYCFCANECNRQSEVSSLRRSIKVP